MSVQPGATSESIESSLPQMRIPTQAEEWSTQLPVAKAVLPSPANKTSHDARERRSKVSELRESSQGRGNRFPETRRHVELNTRTEEVGTKSWLRRMSKVPKDQKEILDSSLSHYPPLPGQDRRSGALPIELLQAFYARVDAIAEEDTSAATGDRQAQAQTTASETEQLTQANNDNDQEVSASQWPESPERPPRKSELPQQGPESSRPPSLSPISQANGQIPPDSPPLSAQPSRLQQLRSSPIPGYSTNGETLRRQAVPNQEQSSATESLSEVDSEVRGQRASSHTSSLRRSRPVSKGQVHDDSHTGTQRQIQETGGNTSEQLIRSSGSEKAHSNVDLLVQIKRTPHPGRCEYSGVGQSGANPTSTFVPSTYQENASQRPAIDADLTSVPHIKSMRTAAPATRSRQSFKDMGTPPRPRTETDDQEVEKDLDGITREAREYRRSVLKPISKTAASPRQPDRDRTSSKAELTSIAAPKANVSPSAGRGAAEHGSLQKHLTKANLFEQFCLAYDDYSGSRKQFDGACRLLSKEYAGRRLHSFLLDDFVFHHTQTYPSYFSGCHTSGEEPLPYTEYFDTIEPTHMKKVIKIADIQGQGASFPDGSSTQQRSGRGLGHVDGGSRMHLEDRMHHDTILRSELDDTARAPVEGEGVDPTSKRYMSQSQHSSVEEWLQRTIADRAHSPELGTPNIDRSLDSHAGSDPIEPRSKSLRRPLPADVEAFSTQKRLRQSDYAVRADATKSSQCQSLAFTTVTNSGRATKPAPSPSLTTPSLSQGRRRTLPPSFSQVKTKKEPDEGASAPAAVPVPRSESVRRSLCTQPRRTPMPSSTPLKPGSTARSTEASRIQPMQRSLARSQKTAFQRFAASWEKLPDESTAREWRQSLYEDVAGKKVNPYALIDVTQWRK